MSTPQTFFPLVSITWLGLDALRHRLGKAWTAFTVRRRRSARHQARLAVAAATRPRPMSHWAAAFRAAAAHRHGRWD